MAKATAMYPMKYLHEIHHLILQVLVLYTDDLSSVVTAPADALAPNGARPSAGTVMIGNLGKFYPLLMIP